MQARQGGGHFRDLCAAPGLRREWIPGGKKEVLVAGFSVLGETIPAVYRSPLGGGERDLTLFSTV